MLRLSKSVLTGVAAAALLASSTAFAQGGLGGRLTDAGTKLDQDVQACRPVNLGEYAQLLHEAAANKQRAEKMKKKGVPVDDAQVNADLANASALFNRAQAALVGQCMRAAQQQQPRTTGALPGGSTPTVGLAGGGQSCTPAATPAAAASGGPRIPTEDEIRHIGDQMETAAEAGKQSEADYHLRSLDELGAQLSKTISDAKRVGEFSTVNVKEAEKRLKQIEDWRKAGEKHRLPCPAKPKSTALNLDNWARDVFAAHNVARNAVGSPPLQWRDDLAEHAQARAAELARAQQLVHAPREGRGTERENILQAPRGYTAAQEMGRWTREASDFVPGKFPDVSKTGNWMDVAHYTQMVSIQTTHIGCGHAMGGGFDWVVCRYDPGGNKDGKPILAEPGSQPQLVMRDKEAPLPPTDTSRVHQTPMAQPQGDRSAARMVAEDVRHPWNEQKPMQPVSQPMTPPPESVLDDVGQTTPPPESILDDVADSTIRPRLIGGDYGHIRGFTIAEGGMAIDVLNAPNPVVINLLGDGMIYGNIDLQQDLDRITISGDDTIVFHLPIAGGNQPIGTYPQIYADTGHFGDTLIANISAPNGLYETTFYKNVIDGEDLTGVFDQCIATGIPANSFLLSFGCIYDGLDNIDLGLIRTPFNLVPGLNAFQTPAPFTFGLSVADQHAVVRQQCQADFGSEGLSQRLDQAEAELNKKIAAGERIDPAEYEKLAAEAQQAKQAAYEADRAAGGGIDARPFLQNSDKAQHLLKTAEAAAGTKLDAPDIGGTPALIDPNAPSPIELKLSDCVM